MGRDSSGEADPQAGVLGVLKRLVRVLTHLSCLACACERLPDHVPDAQFSGAGMCGNTVLEAVLGEVCEPRFGDYVDSMLTRFPCGAPGTPQGCQLDCTTHACPASWGCDGALRCESIRELAQGWSGDLPVSGTDFVLGDVNLDGLVDVLSADQMGLHARLGDGHGDFGGEIDVPFRVARSGPIAFGDLDGDGDLDAVVAVGTGELDVMLADGGALSRVKTLSLGTGERVLGIRAGWFRHQLAGPRDLAVAIDTSTDRVLRLYPGNSIVAYDASEAVDETSSAFANWTDPVVWDVVSGGPFSDELAVGLQTTTGFGVLRLQFLLGSLLLESAPLSSRAIHIDGAPMTLPPNGIGASPSTAFATTCSDAAYGGLSVTATSNAAWLVGRHGEAGVIAFARGPRISFSGATGAEWRPPDVLLAISPSAVRSADLDGDGVPDLVASDGTHLVVLLARGSLEP